MGRYLILAAALAACSGGGKPVVHVEVSATCAEVQGACEVRRFGRPYWEPVGRGTALRNGDWVRTQNASTAHLELLTGGRLDLMPAAVVVLEPTIGIEQGEVHATAADRPLQVRHAKEPATVLAPLSTHRLVAPSGAAVLEVTPLDELVAVEPSNAHPDAGLVRLGPTPTRFPSSLTPGIDARVKFDPRGWVKLTWSPVEGVARYRVQTARDWSFTVETRNADVDSTSWLMRPEGVGFYVWRVAALGPNGQPGEFGYARRLFLEEQTPTDLLVSPADGFTSAQPSVVFNWQTPGGRSSYRLMVSKGVDPQRQPVVNQVTDGDKATAPALQPGTYHWGVYEEGGVLRPLFLKPRKLVVVKRP